METIIGVVDVVEPKISPQTSKMWLLKLSFKTDQGTIWLGAKPGQDTALAGFMSRVIDERDRPTEGPRRMVIATITSMSEAPKPQMPGPRRHLRHLRQPGPPQWPQIETGR